MREETREILKRAGCFDTKPTIDEAIGAVAKVRTRKFCESVEWQQDMDAGEYKQEVVLSSAADMAKAVEEDRSCVVGHMRRIICERVRRGEGGGVVFSEVDEAMRDYVGGCMGAAIGEALRARLRNIDDTSRKDGVRCGYPELGAAKDEYRISNKEIADACFKERPEWAREMIKGRRKRLSAVDMCRIHYKCFRDVSIDPLELFGIDTFGEEWRDMCRQASNMKAAIEYLSGEYVDAIMKDPKKLDRSFTSWCASTGYRKAHFTDWSPDDSLNPYEEYSSFCVSNRQRTIEPDEFWSAVCSWYGLKQEECKKE